jgi:hypothetical protein
MKRKLLLAFSMLSFFVSVGQTNIAPLATATANGSAGTGCSTGPCSTLNDLNFGTCGTQQMWISTSPPNAVGVDYIQFDFPFAQTFDSLIIHHGQTGARFLSGGLIQYWDGANWVNHSNFTNLPMQCISRLYIGKLTADRFRITSFEVSGTQLSNPNFREIEIISAPNGTDDAAVFAVDSPSVFCPGTQDIYATVGNYGLNQIDSVRIGWEFDGVFQSTIKYIGLLDTVNGLFNRSAMVYLGTKPFLAGSNHEIRVWTSFPNGVADTITTNDTLRVNRGPSLPGGVYTINSGAPSSLTNFQSFTELDSIITKFGICSNVTVDVVPFSGPYLEQVNISGFKGGLGRELTINGNGETVSFAATATAERTTFAIENSSYITINNLNVTATGTTYGTALYLNNIENVTIQNSSFLVDTVSTSSNYGCVRISGSQTSPSSPTVFDGLVFRNNQVKGGYYGLTFYGNTASPATNVLVENNSITGFYYYGTYMYYTDGLNFVQNDISRPFRTVLTTVYGVYSFGNSNMLINKNSIHDLFNGSSTSTSACYVIYSSNDATVGNENYITNNLIYNLNHRGTIYSLYDGGSNYTKYYNNTISLDNTSATAGITAGIYGVGAAVGLEFQNNIISITRGGTGAKYGIYLTATPDVLDYNNVFMGSAGTGVQSYAFLGGNIATLDLFRKTGYSTNDIAADPMFTNILTGDLTPTNLSLNASGFSTNQVVDDFNGVPRVATAMDFGAIEVVSTTLDAAVRSITVGSGAFCAGAQPVTATISNNGTTRLNSLTVNWSIDGVAQTPINHTTLIDTIGAVAGNSVILPLTNYTFVNGASVEFKVWVSAPNASVDAFATNDSLEVNVGAGISGAITINPSAAASATNYLSFSDFCEYANSSGVCGPVNVTVSPGTYNENISLRNVAGLSAVNTITIDGLDSSTTILSYSGNGLGMGVVSLQGVNYVTIRNLGLIHTATTSAMGVILANANYNTISNCDIAVNTTSTSSLINGIMTSGSIFSSTTEAFTDRNEFSNNKIAGGYYGYREYGSVNKAVVGSKLINNIFTDVYYYGIYTYYSDSLEIIGNTVDQYTRANVNGDGAYIYYASNTIFTENDIKALDYGVYFYNFTTPFKKTRKSVIANNMVYADTDYGFYIYYTDSVDVYHNTVVGNGSTAAFRYFGTTADTKLDFNIRNNIFYNGGGSFAFEYNLSDTTLGVLDYNLYYSAGNAISIGGLFYADAASHTLASPSLNANSVDGDPQFLGLPNNLHLLGTLANNSGDNAVGITVDIDGDARPFSGSTTVDMGADEFDPPSCPPPSAVAFTNVAISTADVTFSAGAGNAFRYEYGVQGFTLGAGTVVNSATVTSSILGLTSGTCYELYVKALCSASDSSPQVGPYQFCTSYSIPLHEDFETFAVPQTGPTYTNGWTSSSASTPVWESEDATGSNENSTLTGPFFDATTPSTIGGKYMYLETSSGTTGSSNTLISPSVFVPSNAGGLLFSFSYHMFGATMGSLYVVIDTNNVSDTVVTLIGQQQLTQAEGFRDTSVLLTGYQGKSVSLRFIGVRGSSFTGDISIDEVHLIDTVAVDLSLDSILSPFSDCGLSSAEDVTIAIFNPGLSPMSNFNATYVFDGGAPVTELVTATVNPGTTYNFTFSAKVNASVVKSYNMSAYISAAGDGNILNDSITNYTFTSSFSDAINTTTPTKFYTFETDPGNWIEYGANSSWEWGTPSTFYIPAAKSGVKAWVTSAAGNYSANELSYLESSCYDMSTIAPTTPIYLSFYTLYKTELVNDRVWLEYTIDNGRNWSKMIPSVAGVNFYNNTTANVWEGFSNAGAGGWIPVLNDVQGLGGNSAVKFRFVFMSNGTNENDGFAIDEFQVGTVVGLNNQAFDGAKAFGLNPNPAKGLVNLTFSNYDLGNYQINVIDTKGQLVLEELISIGSKSDAKLLSISDLEKGIYLVRISNGASVSTQKLVVE